MALLFPGILIRDSDTVSNFRLMSGITRNRFKVQHALEDGSIVLGVRTSKASLSEVNEQIGKTRFDPRVFEPAKNWLRKIDTFLANNGIHLADVPVSTTKDRFANNLEKVLASSQLDPREETLLRDAIGQARDITPKGESLRFGILFRLLKERGCNPYGEVVQWGRAAHVFADSAGLPPSTANDDLDPIKVRVILNREPAKLEDPGEWLKWYPDKIIQEDCIAAMEFDEIREHRKKGQEIGYFAAFEEVQASINSNNIHNAYETYLRRLASYMRAIGARVRLSDWPKEELERLVKQEKKQRDLLWYLIGSIPVLFGVGTGCWLETLSVLPVSTATLGSAFMGGIAGAGVIARGKALHEAYAARCPSDIAWLLAGTKGTSVSPRA